MIDFDHTERNQMFHTVEHWWADREWHRSVGAAVMEWKDALKTLSHHDEVPLAGESAEVFAAWKKVRDQTDSPKGL